MYRTRYKKKWCEKWLKLWNWELHVILKVLPDGNWPSVTCLVICINRNCHLISALRNGWKLISPSKSFVVYAATSTEKHQWMSHIKKCVDDLLIKRMCWQTCLSGSFHQNIRSPFFCNVKVIVKGQGHSLRPMLYFPRIDNYDEIKSWGWPLQYQDRSVLLSEVKAIQQWHGVLTALNCHTDSSIFFKKWSLY